MTSSEYRQSFLDFFSERGHAIVPSAPLLPSAPNLLFTNAGMNQFVPFFLGERRAPWPRAADTQKCIRAGGKHNDLEDVGFDTYHHTFFEMLGNWSFGDYFKEEALAWSWELLTRVWNIPPQRLYVTVYKPGPGEPAEADEEAYAIWKKILEADGLDASRHILFGGKADNFWMMGDTGPCGPCSEIHLDCTEKGDTGGALVNQDSPWCMEIWNNVFIQFNATAAGDYEPLKERHVDTGLGLERVAGIAATTADFTRFGDLPSNYNCDLFTRFFERLRELTGHPYQATLPLNPENLDPVSRRDCGYRVVADHLRCLTCAIADGILPGNEGRNYVIRRILRRAVLWADRIGLKQGTLESLVPLVAEQLGPVFPEVRQQEEVVRKVVASEEKAFQQTLSRGMQLLERLLEQHPLEIPGEKAFQLYDTYGFPLDLTQLVAREKGRTVDEAGFNREMEKQRARARAARKSEEILVRQDGEEEVTKQAFVGFDPANLEHFQTTLISSETVSDDRGTRHFLQFSETPFYAEMGGQVGDAGWVEIDDKRIEIINTITSADGAILHQANAAAQADRGSPASLTVSRSRRQAIQRHHTATHLLNWALREELGDHIRQAGSLVAPDHLRFDFAHFEAIPAERLAAIEDRVNRAVLANDIVSWYELPIDEKPEDVVAVFGEKYGDRVRVVDIGADVSVSADGALEQRRQAGYSAELCGGTHVGATGEVGPFRILSESSISAGTRRIEAVAGEYALRRFRKQDEELRRISSLLSAPAEAATERLEALLNRMKELENALRQVEQQGLARQAESLGTDTVEHNGLKWVATTAQASAPGDLRTLAMKISEKNGPGVVVLGAAFGDKCSLVALATPEAVEKGVHAGEIIRELTAKLGGKGGGKPDFAMGGGKDPAALPEVLNQFLANLS